MPISTLNPVQAAVLQLSRASYQVEKKPPRIKKKAKASDVETGAEPRRTKTTGSVSRSELFRRIKLLELELKTLSSTAQEAEYKELASKIAKYKSMRLVNATLPSRKVKESKPKRVRQGPATMYLSPKHHKSKVYISPEQRRANKVQDGAPVVNLNAPPKSMLSVVGSSKPLVNPVRKNVQKTLTRKQRLKLVGEFYQLVRLKKKYPPYNRGNKERLLQAA